MLGIDNLKERGAPVLAPGVILIRNDARLPQTLIGGMSSFCRHWSFLRDDAKRQVLETRLAIQGWTSACISGAIRRASPGIDAQNMIKTALERVLAAASLQGCNFLEIGDIKLHSFLTIRYASALGHARQLRRGTPLSPVVGRAEEKL